ncbi:hypothetical protein AB0C27_24900 [Nonomuraea sp. NPDC048882]|uniref:hypothetical protein n=1 Tax=Nonomuraea sp. NPDC048882 TaxID=3154347 RepID=UPI0033E4445B
MFGDIATEAILEGASLEDIPEAYWASLREGWMRDETGAWLLRSFKSSYFGPHCSPGDVAGYEASVNGRGIPDIDLSSTGVQRARELARRGYAFARMALFGLRTMTGHPPMEAYISICRVDDSRDDDLYTGSVTFASLRPNEANYLDDVEDIRDCAVLILEVSDCDTSLPLIPAERGA